MTAHEQADDGPTQTGVCGLEGAASVEGLATDVSAASVYAAARPAEPIETATPAGVAGLDLLATAVRGISVQLAGLTSDVRARLSYDKTKEDAFDRLYADLDQLKKDAAQDSVRPLLLDLILLYDRMELVVRAAQAAGGLGECVNLIAVQSFMDELLEVLYRRDVGLIDAVSPAFDPNLQRAIGVENVADRAQHQQVAAVVRRGFRLGSRALRPEEVIVRRFVEPTRAQANGDSVGGG